MYFIYPKQKYFIYKGWKLLWLLGLSITNDNNELKHMLKIKKLADESHLKARIFIGFTNKNHIFYIKTV